MESEGAADEALLNNEHKKKKIIVKQENYKRTYITSKVNWIKFLSADLVYMKIFWSER
jgi:hypothetical protein